MSSTKARNTARKLIKHIERQTIVANKRMEVLKAGKKDSIHLGKSLKGQRRQFQHWLDVINRRGNPMGRLYEPKSHPRLA